MIHPTAVRKAAITKYEDGATHSAIAGQFGVPTSTLKRWFAEEGVVRKPHATPEEKAAAISAVQRGRTAVEVAREFGVSDTTVSRWVRKAASVERGEPEVTWPEEEIEYAGRWVRRGLVLYPIMEVVRDGS